MALPEELRLQSSRGTLQTMLRTFQTGLRDQESQMSLERCVCKAVPDILCTCIDML